MLWIRPLNIKRAFLFEIGGREEECASRSQMYAPFPPTRDPPTSGILPADVRGSLVRRSMAQAPLRTTSPSRTVDSGSRRSRTPNN